MAGLLRVPRSRGALSGVVLVALGALAALIPFLGPWVYTPARLWLEIVPGVAAAAGGLILLGSANRAFAAFGAWLAALAGAWFIIGPTLSRLWVSSGFPQIGSPVGGRLGRAVGLIGFFTGLGVVIVFFAALALGRLAVVGTRDAELAAAPPGERRQWLRPETPSLRQPRGGRADAARPGKETGMLRGFKNFLMQGDLIIIAVGLVVALAFSTLIKAFTDSIITPLVNAVGGGAAGQGLGWTINGQRIDLGAFISRGHLLHHLRGRHLLHDRCALPGLHATAGHDCVRRTGTHQDLPGMQGIRSAHRRHPLQILRHAAHRHRLNEQPASSRLTRRKVLSHGLSGRLVSAC